MLDKWHKKEKPVFTGIARGISGFAFGRVSAAAGGGGGAAYTQNSGGVINDYQEAGGDKYRAHIFIKLLDFLDILMSIRVHNPSDSDDHDYDHDHLHHGC